MERRPYHVDGKSKVLAAFDEGHRNVLAVMATGAGKTVFAGDIVADVLGGELPICDKRRAVWNVHRKTLVTQARDSVEKFYGITGGIEMGGARAGDSPFVLTCTPTLKNRIQSGAYRRDHFDLCVDDEAHRSLSPSNKFIHQNLDACTLGITATPRRGDQKDLMAFYDVKPVDISLHELIEQGWLCDVEIVNFPLQIDLTEVKTKGGDFDEGELGHAIEPYLDEAARKLSEFRGRKMLAYLPLRRLSREFCEAAGRHGLDIRHVDGDTPKEELDDLIEKLRLGLIDGLSNAMLLTEGVDIPWADLILNLRPTQSWTLYVQIFGRITRTWEGKETGLFLDPLWQCEQHSVLKRPACVVAQDDVEESKLAEKLAGGGTLDEARKAVRDDRVNKLRDMLRRSAHRRSRRVNAMEFFLDIGDLDCAEYQPMARWETAAITGAQQESLERAGFDIGAVRDKGHASAVLGALADRRERGMATVKMCRYAAALGMDDPWARRFEEVRDFINTNKGQK